MGDSESLHCRLDQMLASSKKLKSNLCDLSQDFCVLRDQVDSIDEKEIQKCFSLEPWTLATS